MSYIFLRTFWFFLLFTHTLPAACHPELDPDIAIFLDNLMIRDCGFYTLLGSKPMTEFDITEMVDTSEEGLQNDYKQYVAALPLEKKTSCVSYADYREHALDNNSKPGGHIFDRKRRWEAWVRKMGLVSTARYKLVQWNGAYQAGLFINVPQMVHHLKQYQQEIESVTEMHFDPTTILDEIECKDSIFWKKVFASHYLHGLLLGFGQKNAYLFDWAQSKELSFNHFSDNQRWQKNIHRIAKTHVSIRDLPIPSFVTFGLCDEQVERYKKERTQIIEFLEKKDWMPFVLRCFEKKMAVE